MTVIHREYGQGTMTAHGMTGQPMRYRLEVYRDARGIICADGMLDGPASAVIQAALAGKLVTIELKDGGTIAAHLSNVQPNGGTAHAKFVVSGQAPGFAA
jgi:hypothetical protein